MPETPDVKIARLEERIASLIATVERMHTENRVRLDSQDVKLDRLVAAFNMGRGGAVAAAKIGGLMLLALAAGGWAVDHIIAWFKP